jgi:DegT/DnrJ/EryC1/StrS aminotransferase family
MRVDRERQLERLLEERTGRECVYVPSGRFGIYIALVSSLSRGDRILMSPVNDDVVLFTVLAAGLRPVMAPLSSEDGNIDPRAVPKETWRSIHGVLTTNLYGLADRLPELRERCDHHGLVLIEDAAHALHSDVAGQPVGCFGDASIFSFSKHPSGSGGVVAPAERSQRSALIEIRDRLVSARPARVRGADALRPAVLATLERLRLRSAVRSLRRRLGMHERLDHRMPLHADQLRLALPATPSLDPLDHWVRVDMHDYRFVKPERSLERTVDWLRSRSAEDRERRIGGVRRLAELAFAAPAVRQREPQGLYRVPLLVRDREAAGERLAARGHPLHYVYDPPLDDYAGDAFVNPSPAPDVARWWARHALPVDPLFAEMAIDALSDVQAAPAPPSANCETAAPCDGS